MPKKKQAHDRCFLFSSADVKSEPSLWDLIQRYFPEPYNKIYSDAERVYQIAKHDLLRKAYPGIKVYEHEAMCAVHEAAIDAHEKHPEWKAPEIADHIAQDPKVISFIGKSWNQYGRNTVIDWIRHAVKIPPGRPRKPSK